MVTATQPNYTNRQLAEIAQVPLRVLERQIVVMQHGIPELNSALLDDRIKHGPAERIARLPQDRQLAELESHLQGSGKRGQRTVMTDLTQLADQIDRLAKRWTDQDRKIAGCVLADIAEKLGGR